MKTCFLALAIAAALTQPLQAQKITYSSGSISLNMPSGGNIVSRDSWASGTGNEWHLWIEPGDGNYLTFAPAGWSRSVAGIQLNHAPYLRATALYDTTRRPPSGASAAYNKQAGAGSTIITPQLTGERRVKLFASEAKMVDNDTMVFGISYKASQQTGHRLILKYNSIKNGVINQVFIPITDTGATHGIADYDLNTTRQIRAIRTHAGETPAVFTSGSFMTGFSNAVMFTGLPLSETPRNLFVSLVPQGITAADSTMIVAELQQQGTKKGEWISVQSDTITNMKGDASHDPNDITVTPVCLKLPQTTQTLHYRINFQNLGGGNAKAVKVVFFAPGQINWVKKAMNIKAAFSEITNYSLTDIEYDGVGRKIIFTFPETPGRLLEGTNFVQDAYINPLTMGYVEFDIEVTPGTDLNAKDTINAHADIYFLSVFPSPNVVTGAMVSAGTAPPGTQGYEQAVRTNPAVSGYLDACNQQPVKCDCKNPKGIWCWICCYWWVLAIILLLIFVVWLLRRRRRP